MCEQERDPRARGEAVEHARGQLLVAAGRARQVGDHNPRSGLRGHLLPEEQHRAVLVVREQHLVSALEPDGSGDRVHGGRRVRGERDRGRPRRGRAPPPTRARGRARPEAPWRGTAPARLHGAPKRLLVAVHATRDGAEGAVVQEHDRGIEHEERPELGRGERHRRDAIRAPPRPPPADRTTRPGARYPSRPGAHSSAGRASASRAEGHRFEPCCAHRPRPSPRSMGCVRRAGRRRSGRGCCS